MSSPVLAWQGRGAVAKTTALTSRPSLGVHNARLWLTYLGDQADAFTYYVYSQTTDATNLNLKFSSPQRILHSGSKAPLQLPMGSQIGLRVVQFGGAGQPQTLVLWATWTIAGKTSASMYLYSDQTTLWTPYELPPLSNYPIVEGCLGVVNSGTTAESLMFFGLVPRTGSQTNVVVYTYWAPEDRIWSSYHTYTPNTTPTGYNSICILDWTNATQMVLGYYQKGGNPSSAQLDLYAHDGSDEPTRRFTYKGLFTNNGRGVGDSARGGMQSAQNIPEPDLVYVAFEGVDAGAVGKVWVCVHTDKWYYGASVLDKYTTTCPGIAAWKGTIFCAWTQDDNSGNIQFAVGGFNG